MEDVEAADRTAVALRSPTTPRLHPKKKRPSVNLLRVALFMVRRRSAGTKEPLHADVVKPGGRGLWKALLGAVRPLHHQPQLEHAAPAPARDLFHDVLAPSSPSASEGFSSSDGMSRYASADDLRALDTGGSDDEAGGDGGEIQAVDIDVRAGEFIAKFYEQMRLQQLALKDD